MGALAGGAVAAVVGHNPPRSSPPSSGSASLSQQDIGGATQPGAGSTAPSAPPSASGPLSASAIAALVDPAIVDVTSTLADQGATAAGTGMIITSSGEVLTNNHVIDGATSIRVRVGGVGASHSAHVVRTDVTGDIALLQIDNVSDLHTIHVGDSSSVSVGDLVVALGNALGRGGVPAVSPGRVTNLNQTITASDQGGGNAETLNGLIEINAPIQPGDSGGPLVDTSGRVVGMDTAASVGRFRRSAATVAYAIPINAAMSMVHQLEIGGGSTAAPVQTAQRPILGVQIQDATAQGASGALVAGVLAGGPAEAAGIGAGDVIVGFDGQTIDSSTALGTAIQAHKPGDRVQVTWVDQSGQQHTATVSLVAAPSA
jgi:S1-C subfamily serine protease